MDPLDESVQAEHERLLQLYRERISAYKSVNAELADLEWTLTDIERQINELRPLTSAEDKDANRRLHDLERWKSSLEESILQRLYLAESLVAHIAALRNALQLGGVNADDTTTEAP